MLRFIKRWWPSSEKPVKAPANALDVLREWAERHELTMRPVRDDGGAIIEGRTGTLPWRLEWGPAQRHYIEGFELRWRAELDFGADWQLLVMNRSLQEAMERDVFDQYMEGAQTQIDDQTPPEMRWLVMFTKLSAAEMGILRATFVAVGNAKVLLQQWLEGPLTQALAALGLDEAHPQVLMIGRGRLMLRTELNHTDEGQLDAWRRLFETALREAQRVAQNHAAAPAPSTQASLWSSTAIPGEEPR